MTRAEMLELFTPIYDEFAMMKFAEHTMKHPQLFDVIVDHTRQWRYSSMSGLGEWEAVDEDSSEGSDHFVMGYQTVGNQAKYRKYFYVTFEATDQMEYAAMKKKIVQAEALGQGGRARAENNTAAILYNGFANAGPDGQILFSDSHPKNPEETGTTYDNLLSGPFSHDNLELAETQISNNHYDMDGEPIEVAEKPIIVYAPALAGQVERVLSERADKRPGIDNRPQEYNRFAGKYRTMEWIRLGAQMGGSDTAWYIIWPSLKMLKMVWSMKPKFASWIDNLNHRYYFDGWELFVTLPTNWRCGFASTGL